MTSQNNFAMRTNCIFCYNMLKDTYFKKDYSNYVAHYMVDLNYNIDNMMKIPFNIYIYM